MRSATCWVSRLSCCCNCWFCAVLAPSCDDNDDNATDCCSMVVFSSSVAFAISFKVAASALSC